MLSKILFAAAIAISATNAQTLTEASPPWNYAIGTGPSGSTQVPQAAHISKIVFFFGTSSSGNFGAI